MMSHRILPAVLLLCTLAAACGESPTGTDTQAQPAGASYDGGGFGIGSGYVADEDGGGFGMGGGYVAADDGGYTIGSGNRELSEGDSIDSGGATTTTSTTTSGDTAERGGYTMGSGG